jgi:hypothetical protein
MKSMDKFITTGKGQNLKKANPNAHAQQFKWNRQATSFIEISIEAGILLGGKHEAYFVLGLAGIEPMPS